MGLARVHSTFKETKLAKPPAPPTLRAGVAPTAPKVATRSINWPTPGPVWGTSFNRKVKAPVVHTHAVKHGVD